MKDTSIPVMMNVVTALGLRCFYEKKIFESWVSKFFLSISKNLVEKKISKKKIFASGSANLKKMKKKISKTFSEKKFFEFFFKLS